MLIHNLGYPRIGSNRELKKACEKYWSGQIDQHQLLDAGAKIREAHWRIQREAGIDLIPCNDFSFYDQVLDMSCALGAIPARYAALAEQLEMSELDRYFAMARGYQRDGHDVIAMEMTKWFDTNYHYIVPEFTREQTFDFTSRKVIEEFKEAQAQGVTPKPVLIGPVSFLLLGKEKQAGFHRIELLDRLMPAYVHLLRALKDAGARDVQLDEPYLVMDLDEASRAAYQSAYATLREAVPELRLILTTYFGGLQENAELAVSLPVHALHIDLVRAPDQLGTVLRLLPESVSLSMGIVDGRNIWKNDYTKSLALINEAVARIGAARVMIAASCSLLHVPCDLAEEDNEIALPGAIKRWLVFAKQKLEELRHVRDMAGSDACGSISTQLADNIKDIDSRAQAALIHKPHIKDRVRSTSLEDTRRASAFAERQRDQRNALSLPLFPTTTIGSLPQTAEVRQLRVRLRKGQLRMEEYEADIKKRIEEAIHWQEQIGVDILVHGEFERNDMVQYFGEMLQGCAITQNGWVQSYGSRCVKPPIIFGDVERKEPMTVKWTQYAQSLTAKRVKGMLTGPVTILQWSFVRDDQPRRDTAMQIAWAIRDEVRDLEQGGVRIIQIDEPALREGLPLRHADWESYLQWAVEAFKLASSGVQDETQIHTHMCYSEFNDIIENIAKLDADVITIETSRSQMKLLDVFARFEYPNEIGPGVYDIHSPRVPSQEEMVSLLKKAADVIPAERLWVNPDCGLKTRGWPETKVSLENMIAAARELRQAELA